MSANLARGWYMVSPLNTSLKWIDMAVDIFSSRKALCWMNVECYILEGSTVNGPEFMFMADTRCHHTVATDMPLGNEEMFQMDGIRTGWHSGKCHCVCSHRFTSDRC